MINSMKPADRVGHDEKNGEVLKKIHDIYGPAEEKQRDPVKKLGKDEFFKIMITQIQHQDPLKPYDNENMAAQMAQFTALEQMTNVNANLEKLTQSQQPLHNLGAANLIGKEITVDSSHVIHQEGKYTDIEFDLPADAAEVRVSILNEKGENICDIEKGEQKKGKVKVSWDGRGSNNMPAKSGTYLFQISAKSPRGVSIPVQTQHNSIVNGVEFNGKDTVLLTGDIRNPQKILLRDVSRIVDSRSLPPASASAVSKSPVTDDSNNSADEGSDLAQPRMVEGYEPGTASKFTPINLPAWNAASQKPDVMPQKPREVPRDGALDLTEANPVAAAMAEGSGFPGQNISEIDDVNPAARKMGVSADQQSVPSSQDGSTSGKWME